MGARAPILGPSHGPGLILDGEEGTNGEERKKKRAQEDKNQIGALRAPAQMIAPVMTLITPLWIRIVTAAITMAGRCFFFFSAFVQQL